MMFGLKKYRKVTFDGTEDCCKIWKKTEKLYRPNAVRNFYYTLEITE